MPDEDTGVPSSEGGQMPELPEDLRSDTALAPHIKEGGEVDWVGIAKSAVHAQRLVGADKVVLPKEDSPAEDWNNFFKKLGRPEDAAGYELAPPEGVEVPFSEEDAVLQGYRTAAHEAGLSKSQARKLFEWYAKQTSEVLAAHETEREKTHTEAKALLEREFGAALPQHLQLAQNALKHFGGEDLTAMLNETGLGDNPALVKAFIKVGKAMSEDTLSGGIEPGRFGMTPDLAQKRIHELRADPAWRNALDPRHGDVMEEIRKLGEVIAASRAA